MPLIVCDEGRDAVCQRQEVEHSHFLESLSSCFACDWMVSVVAGVVPVIGTEKNPLNESADWETHLQERHGQG